MKLLLETHCKYTIYISYRRKENCFTDGDLENQSKRKQLVTLYEDMHYLSYIDICIHGLQIMHIKPLITRSEEPELELYYRHTVCDLLV